MSFCSFNSKFNESNDSDRSIFVFLMPGFIDPLNFDPDDSGGKCRWTLFRRLRQIIMEILQQIQSDSRATFIPKTNQKCISGSIQCRKNQMCKLIRLIKVQMNLRTKEPTQIWIGTYFMLVLASGKKQKWYNLCQITSHLFQNNCSNLI